MAEKVQEVDAPSRVLVSPGKVVVILLLCSTLYVALQFFLLLSEVERLATGPHAAVVASGSIGFLSTGFVVLMFFTAILVGIAIRTPKGASRRVIFWAHAPIIGIQLYQIYTRYRPMVISYFSEMCYKALKNNPNDPFVAMACPKILPKSWEHAALPIISDEHSSMLTGLTVLTIFQGELLVAYAFALLIIMIEKGRRAAGKNLTGQAKLDSQHDGATIADLNLKPVVTVKTSTAIGTVIDLLSQKGFQQIPVVSDDSEQLVGIVTLANLVSYILRGCGTVDTPVSQAMSDLSRLPSFVAPAASSSGAGTSAYQRGSMSEITVNTPLSDLTLFFEHDSAAVVTKATANGVTPVHVVTELDLIRYLANRHR